MPSKLPQKTIILYLPVLHEGYRKLFDTFPDYKTIWILDLDITNQYRELQKDIRALNPRLGITALQSWYPDRTIKIVGITDFAKINTQNNSVVMPDEDISHDITKKYLEKAKVKYHPIFLRWDRLNSNANIPVDSDIEISENDFDKYMISSAHIEGQKSSDIWRRVGAFVIKEGERILTDHNHALPHTHTPWLEGDPRNNYKKGEDIGASTFIHAEASIIASAAKKGISLKGADMYVTTFPCPNCAMLIANSGIKKLYYTEGYAVLNGKAVLQEKGVQIIKVNVELKRLSPETYMTYDDN